MKLTTLRFDNDLRPGAIVGDEVLDLIAAGSLLPAAKGLPSNLKGLFAAGPGALGKVSAVISEAGRDTVRKQLRAIGALYPLADATFAPVVPDAAIVLSGSMNSHGHNHEMGGSTPEHPCAFHKVPSALAASGDAIVLPPGHSEMIDWEGEFCVVIGTRCHQVSVARAWDHIVGFTLLNDVSARDLAMPFMSAIGPVAAAQAWERNVLGKNFPTFAPLGPVIATKDEFPFPFAYHLETLVNGKVMQTSHEDDLVFGPAEMVSYFSQFYIFEPGDIISMGSPPGVGMARKPPQFLKPGDLVEVRSAGIGSLVNRVVQPTAS